MFLKRELRARSEPGSWTTGAGVLAIALASAWLLAVNTTAFGLGLAPDSVDYLSAADCLMAGEDMLTAAGKPFATWPPLYPVMVAGLARLLDSTSHEAARYLAVASMFALICATGSLGWAVTRSRLATLLACILVASNSDVVWVFSMAFSESLFTVLLTVLATLLSGVRSKSQAGSHLVRLSLVGGALCLQRYVGVALVLVGGACLATSFPRPLWGRVARGAVFVLASCLPLFAWALRNHLITGFASGHDRGPWASGQDPWFILYRYLVVAGDWLLLDLNHAARVGAGVLLLGGVVAGFAFGRARGSPIVRRSLAPLALLVGYLASQLLLNAGYDLDGIGPRQLVPVAPIVTSLIVGLVPLGVRMLASRFPRSGRVAAGTVAAVACAQILTAAVHLEGQFGHWSRGLVPFGYSQSVWTESDVVEWLTANGPRGTVLSNDPHGFYFCNRIRATALPELLPQLRGLARQLAREDKEVHILWFEHNPRSIFPAKYFEKHLRVEEVFQGRDGAVYRLRV